MEEHILVIEDDENFRKTLINLLEMKGYNTSGAKDGLHAIEMAKKKPFELIISDVRLPGIDGIEAVAKIKEDEAKTIRTMIITGYADKEAPIRAIRLGVDAYIYKPFKMEVFLHSVNRLIRDYRLEKTMQYYRQLSILDGLTEVFNHRYFHEVMVREISRAKRFSHPLSLLMVDVDDFKQYNDAYGHIAGDRALRKVAHVFTEAIRKLDLVFRYGGEEFTIILVETDREGALVIAERIRREVEKTKFEEDGSIVVKLTVSIGLASYPKDTQYKEGLIQKVDKALYKAKHLGKNRVCYLDGTNNTE